MGLFNAVNEALKEEREEREKTQSRKRLVLRLVASIIIVIVSFVNAIYTPKLISASMQPTTTQIVSEQFTNSTIAVEKLKMYDGVFTWAYIMIGLTVMLALVFFIIALAKLISRW